MRSPRLVTSIAATGALLALLAGCGQGGGPSTSASPASPAPSASGATPTPTPTPSKKPTVPASTNLDKVEVKGAYGKEPKITFKAPFAINKTQTTVLEPTDGATVKSGQSVTVNYYGVNGRTGKKFDDSFSRGAPVTFPLDQVVPGFKKGLVGQKQGSRVLVAMPGPDGYDGSGGSPQAGIEVGDTLLFVVDLVGVQLDGPEGEKVTPKAGLPTVTDAKGVPSVKISGEAPKQLQIQPLIKGTGPKVAATDTVTFNYRWYAWNGKLLEDSYATKKPASTELSGLLTGISKGLTGQTVGSRVLLVVPNAYPNGNASPPVGKGEAVVLVIDLLFTQKAQ